MCTGEFDCVHGHVPFSAVVHVFKPTFNQIVTVLNSSLSIELYKIEDS